MKVNYKNHKGETRIRDIEIYDIYLGSSPYHKADQWFIRAMDNEKETFHTYTLKDCNFRMESEEISYDICIETNFDQASKSIEKILDELANLYNTINELKENDK